ncbi:hypothetical protein AJ80_03397 [Polytolypa hystricis UAMH7299]|uniref:DUF6536 domain-containing protein n=1 Tax=Polytolypa hystricis (strain UAMH7299) TaxID=1447883 RepID=A0A2B7YIG6_POLH7|nr:hypothetical protein AJ80_03397 [Polytolypa hystricis UAMH7299]
MRSENRQNEASELLEKPQSGRRKNTTGWRAGVVSCAITAVVVFTLNLAFTVWAIRTTGLEEGGRGILFTGACSRVRYLNTTAHILLNILSTALLGASNYCMQCLSAPSRREVDLAHANRRWLDIGVPNIRNLRHIQGKRVVLWACLGISSLPLHLFYNSAIFASTAAYQYQIIAANDDFIQDGGFDRIHSFNRLGLDPYLVFHLHEAAIAGRLERLDPSTCIQSYAQDFQTEWGNVILVSNDTGRSAETYPLLKTDYVGVGFTTSSMECPQDPYHWVCNIASSCLYGGDVPCKYKIPELVEHSSNWTVLDHKIGYCLAEKEEEQCTLMFSLPIAITVIVMNLSKAVLMCLTLYTVKDNPLITIGDAVASFLQRPDPATENMCLLSRGDLQTLPHIWPAGPKPWKPVKQSWGRSASGGRWGLFFFTFIAALALTFGFLTFGTSQIAGPRDIKSLWNLGLGTINSLTIIRGWNIPPTGAGGLILNSSIANLAQVILSAVYLVYNALMTSMLMAHEWNSYSRKRKGLRVSSVPHGSQRSTYFLQLPYRFSIPLLTMSGVLHWLISQSIFLVSVDAHNCTKGANGADPSKPVPCVRNRTVDFLSCGYSPIAMIFVIIVAGIMFAFGVGTAMRRLPPGIPLAGSCSAAISAACHSHNDGPEAAVLPLQWGVTHDDANGETPGNDSQHCSFSSKEVWPPEEDALYAGTQFDGLGEKASLPSPGCKRVK